MQTGCIFSLHPPARLFRIRVSRAEEGGQGAKAQRAHFPLPLHSPGPSGMMSAPRGCLGSPSVKWIWERGERPGTHSSCANHRPERGRGQGRHRAAGPFTWPTGRAWTLSTQQRLVGLGAGSPGLDFSSSRAGRGPGHWRENVRNVPGASTYPRRGQGKGPAEGRSRVGAEGLGRSKPVCSPVPSPVVPPAAPRAPCSAPHPRPPS